MSNLMRDQSRAINPQEAGNGLLPGGQGGVPWPANGSSDRPVLHLGLMRSLQLHRKLAILIALTGLLGAVAYMLLVQRYYRAQSVVSIQPTATKLLDDGRNATIPEPNSYETLMRDQLAIITRDDVLTEAAIRLGEKPPIAPGTLIELSRSLDIARLGYGYAIKAQGKDPVAAANIANAVAEAYIAVATREGKTGDSERVTILREEKQRVQQELDADRAEQQQLNSQLGIVGVGVSTPDLYDSDIDRIRQELIKARAASDEAASRLLTVQSVSGDSSTALDAEADQLISADAGLVAMKGSFFQRRAALTSQMANLTPNHPQYKQDAEELAQINKSIDTLTKDLRNKAATNLKQRLRNDMTRSSTLEARLDAQLGKMTSAAGSVTAKMQRANELAVNITRLQTRYALLEEQLQNQLLELQLPGNAHIAIAAIAPIKTSDLGKLRNAMVIALFGFLLAIGAALLANVLDDKVYIAADLQQALGFAPMAVLPDFNQVSLGVAEEHVLRLTAGIEFARQQGNLKSCLFTGTGPGTGVTTVTSKVRTVLESMGRATVLMDASGTPPPPTHSSKNYDEENGPPRASRSTALVQQVAQEAETQEEGLVLTDTAPLAVSAETEYLSRFVDAAIVVVQSGVTTRKELRETAERLQRLDVAAVGFVLNKVDLKKADPDFRKSVLAIERHQKAQSRSYARDTERSGNDFSAHAPKPKSKPAPEPEEAPVTAQASDPEPPSRVSPAPADRPWQSRPVAPVTTDLSALIADLPPQQAPVETKRTPATAPLRPEPTPISATAPPVNEPKPSAPSRPEGTFRSDGPIPINQIGRDVVSPAAVTPAALDAAINPQPIDPAFQPKPTSWAESWKRFSSPAPAVPSAPVETPAAATSYQATPEPLATPAPDATRYSWMEPATPIPPQAKPLWSSTATPVDSQPAMPATNFLITPPPPAEPTPVIGMAGAEPQLDAATRITGLRNLIFSLGMKPVQPAEPLAEALASAPPKPVAAPPEPRWSQMAAAEPVRPPVPAPEPPPAVTTVQSTPPAAQPPYPPKASAPKPESFAASARTMPRAETRTEKTSASPTLLTAPPEFLPPQPEPDSNNSERRPKGPAARRERRETFDEVDTLPSWRGQYRKKP